MRKFIYSIFILISFISIVGCSDTQEEEYTITYSTQKVIEKKVYIFGVHPLHNPKKLFEVYQPLVEYINAQLVDARIKLEASRNYATYNKKLFDGYFDLSLPNPYQTIIAANKGYEIFGKMGDDANFRGIFIARKDSNIKSIDNIKGKIVSYPAKTALAATMLPQYFLHINGINIKKDIKNSYVGSQESSIMNVYLKKSIVGSTWTPPWIAFVKENPKISEQLEIIWKTKPLLNNGLVVKKDFPKELLSQISNIIFTLHTHTKGKEILQGMELSRFEKADYHTYDKVRDFLKIFDKEVRSLEVGR